MVPPAARSARRGTGLCFAIADAGSGSAVGAGGLWLQNRPAGRATAGYPVCAAHRGRGIAGSALTALTTFGWTIPALYRAGLYIEPWNSSSGSGILGAELAKKAAVVGSDVLLNESSLVVEAEDAHEVHDDTSTGGFEAPGR